MIDGNEVMIDEGEKEKKRERRLHGEIKLCWSTCDYYQVTLLPSHYFSPFVPISKLPAIDSSIEYLTDLEGTQVTFDAVTEPPFNFPAQKWIILEKLGEDSNRLTKEDIAAELGPSNTSGKFLCRPASEEDDNIPAFLRIYQQLPIAGTERRKPLYGLDRLSTPLPTT